MTMTIEELDTAIAALYEAIETKKQEISCLYAKIDELEYEGRIMNLSQTPAIAGEYDTNIEWGWEPPYTHPDPAENDPMDDYYAISMREDLIRRFCGYARCNHGVKPDRTRSGKSKIVAKLKKARRNLNRKED